MSAGKYLAVASLIIAIVLMTGPTGILSARNSRQEATHQPAAPAPDAQSGSNAQSAQSGEPDRVTLPSGTAISVRIADRVDSSHDHAGDLFTGIVDPSVLIDNQVVIPRGTEAHVRMLVDKKGHHLHGKAEVQLALISLVMNGRKLEVESGAYKREKGALAAKTGGAVAPAEGAAAVTAADVALAASPAGAVAAPVIAVFRSAKVELEPGSRVSFALTSDFMFDKPPATNAQP